MSGNLGFAALSPGLEWRPLEERSAHPIGSTLFEPVPLEAAGIATNVSLPNITRYYRELTATGGYYGVSTGDFDNDGLVDFFLTNPTGDNRLYRNLGGFKFEDVTAAVGIAGNMAWSTGASFVDLNNDGRLDLFVCRYLQPNLLFINQGFGTNGMPQFVERAEQYGLNSVRASMHMVFADYDLDGDLDGYLATTYAPPPAGTNLQVRYENDVPFVVDELREYWELVIHQLEGRATLTDSGQFDHLFRNDGGRFVDVTENAGIDGAGSTLAAVALDYNGDGWPDIYVANDFYATDKLYLNKGDGTFRDVAAEALPHTPLSSMGCDFGDLNNDGLPDLIATDMLGTTHYRRNVMLGEISMRLWSLEFSEPHQYSRNAVFLNTGTSRMMEVAYLTGMAATDWTWGPRIEDFDNDGRQDVLFTNGALRDVQNADLVNYADTNFKQSRARWTKFWVDQEPQAEANLAFRNLGDLRFEDVSAEWGFNHVGVSYGAATADFDNDGDLDLVVNNAFEPPQLFRNRSPAGNVVRVALVGTTNNRFGVGATLKLSAGGEMQTRYVTVARGWQSGSETTMHFGLGGAERVDSLTVTWPGGQRQNFENLAPNRLYRITETVGSTSTSPDEPASALFNASDRLNEFQHQRSTFDELAANRLLPQRFSWSRLALATGDVDGDGDADIFVDGGEGRAGRLLLMNGDGTPDELLLPRFESGEGWLAADAVFFDLEGDGDLDLAVVGGVQQPSTVDSSTEGLRLYRNDGTNGFHLVAGESLPRVGPNLNCVAAGDYDHDGDLDLFVGGGAPFGGYPVATPSRLLRNDSGILVDASPAALESIGYATDAEWQDINGDGVLDLLVTSEWGPVRWFLGGDGTLQEATDQGSLRRTGFWSCLAGGDLDGDGDIDFVVGNRGLNTVYRASEDQPAVLYHHDAVAGEVPAIIEAYYENGRLLPLRGFDQLVRTIPSLGAQVINFHEFASAALSELVPAQELRGARRFSATTLESGVLRNNGAGGFTFEALPYLAQAAPINDVALSDVTGDSLLDIVAAQNDFSIAPVVGRFDGGVSLVLTGDGQGTFAPLSPTISGVMVPNAARRVRVVDVSGDDLADLVFGVPGAGLTVFLAQPGAEAPAQRTATNP